MEKSTIKMNQKEFQQLINDLIETKNKYRELNEKYHHAIIIDEEEEKNYAK